MRKLAMVLVLVAGCHKVVERKDFEVGDTGYTVSGVVETDCSPPNARCTVTKTENGWSAPGGGFEVSTAPVPDTEELERNCERGVPHVRKVGEGTVVTCDYKDGDRNRFDQTGYFPLSGGKTLVCESRGDFEEDQGCGSVRKK